jgi:hypothetical protein
MPSASGEARGDLLRGLAPGEVHVRLASGGALGRRARAAEEDLRQRVLAEADARVLDLVVLPGEAERALRPADPAQHREELLGPGVALVVVQVVAEPALFDRVAAGDDVEQQPSARDALERRGNTRL